MSGEDDLRREAVAFARYLISADPSPALIDRYARAVAARIAERPDRVVRAARRSPLLLGPLDAAAALIDRHHQLRQRLLLLSAILEASPDHCALYLARDYSRWETVRLALALAMLAPVRALVGVPLFVILDRGRERR